MTPPGWVVAPDVSKERDIFMFKGRWTILRGPLIIEDKGDIFVRNVGNYLPSDVASHPRRPEASVTPQ